VTKGFVRAAESVRLASDRALSSDADAGGTISSAWRRYVKDSVGFPVCAARSAMAS
jgi:hypothetical protein